MSTAVRVQVVLVPVCVVRTLAGMQTRVIVLDMACRGLPMTTEMKFEEKN